MKLILAVVLVGLLPTAAHAWEAVVSGNQQNAYASGLIEDIAMRGERYAVKITGQDAVAGCAIVHRLAADDERVVRYTIGGRYLWVSDGILPLVLFARAHNVPVQVYVQRGHNDACVIDRLRTCFQPENCVGPPPPI